MVFIRLSALGDQELAGISRTVNAAFSSKVFAADDAAGNTHHAFAELHTTAKHATKNFWDHADFVCYNDKAGYASWGARNC
eukprot:CAMPEP_0173377476 /NCGR_PEP_ID=MMETSP1356-20130122/716_1 /TAXON_ID=77927 ORGANISM="Hemiselmis virescens, Strain PCC157" /NCGR_SAMPLE_ID=MMETSP1356 /ASSEMBLY_ACC=CAM_ASM_000847 /LENGTH=80 /DNA_ID=CAMNT_0014330239 /DNA_START=31 /DNA_END=273 /DNA_ORIENTATION=-